MSYPHGTILRPAVERFFEKVSIQEDGCHIWTAGKAGEGYGYFYTGSTPQGQHGRIYAHRWSYEFHVGPIPDGLHLDHLCGNRACVNPEHLEPVTPLENVHRSHGNNSKTHCPSGHPYAGENLRMYRGARFCRACAKEYHRNRRSTQRSAA